MAEAEHTTRLAGETIFRQARECNPREEPDALTRTSGSVRGARGNSGPYRDETVALSERRVAKGVKILELGVSQAAGYLQFHAPKYVLGELAQELHQEEGEQTTRMAMAILANAVIFHTSACRQLPLRRSVPHTKACTQTPERQIVLVLGSPNRYKLPQTIASDGLQFFKKSSAL